MKENKGQKQPPDPSDSGSGSSSESSTENNSGDDEPIDNNDKGRNSKEAKSKFKGKRHKSTSNITVKHKDKWIRDPAQRLDSFIKVNTRFGGKQGEDVLAWFARLENNFEIFEIKSKCRTPFAIALLTDGAEACYRNWKKRFPDLQKSWTEFKKMMVATYKHVKYDTLLLNELVNARTQNNNFDEYVAKYENFRSLVSLSADDFLRILFTLGLPKRIKDQLVPKRPVTFDEAKTMAMNCWQLNKQEDNLTQINQSYSVSTNDKRKLKQNGNNYEKPKNKTDQNNQSKPKLSCSYCRKTNHVAENCFIRKRDEKEGKNKNQSEEKVKRNENTERNSRGNRRKRYHNGRSPSSSRNDQNYQQTSQNIRPPNNRYNGVQNNY